MNSGLIFGATLDGTGRGRPLEHLPEPTDSEAGVVWMHLDYQDVDAQNWLNNHSGIDPLVAAALLDEDSRPRLTQFSAGLLVNLRGVNLNEGAAAEDMVAMRIWLEPKRIITTRRRQVRSPRELYEALESGHGPINAGDFLVQLSGRLGEHVEIVIDSIEAAIESAETDFTADAGQPAYGGEFGALRRKTARLRRYLAPQRETLERLSRLDSALFSPAQKSALHEHADVITRHLEDLDLCRERATVAQEEFLNMLAQRQNERMYVLAIVAAVFLPLSFLTGLFGMNIAGMPGLENPTAFSIAVAAMLACGGGIIALFRWKKWL